MRDYYNLIVSVYEGVRDGERQIDSRRSVCYGLYVADEDGDVGSFLVPDQYLVHHPERSRLILRQSLTCH